MSQTKQEKIALFAGSFDPFTRAHAALVDSALCLFDRVVSGVGRNVSRRALLSERQRLSLIRDLYSNSERVEVEVYEGLTVNFAREIGAVALVRGVRGVADLEAERNYDTVNRELAPEIQTLLLLTPPKMMHISSSAVRELLSFAERRCVEEMMPEGVEIEKYLE